MVDNNRNRKTHKKIIRRGLSLYKTDGSPYWYARIWVSGERRYIVKSTRETSRLTAEDVAEEILNDLKQRKFVDGVPHRRAFSYFANMLMEEQERLSGTVRSPRFASTDKSILHRKNDGVLTYFGKRDIGSITTADLRDYLKLIDDNRTKPLSPGTKNKHIIVIRKVLRTAYEDGAIDVIPPTPQVPRKDNPRPWFDEDDYSRLLKTAREVADQNVDVRGIRITREIYYFILFMVHSFLRPTESEVFALKHNDIRLRSDPKRLEIKVYGKTGMRTATTTQDAPDFYEHLKQLYPDHGSDDYVFFPDYPNRTTALRNVNRQFNYILNEADLKNAGGGLKHTVYSLRHTGLNLRILKSKGNVNIFTLAKVAGTSVDQLERFYLKHLPIDERMAENLQTFGD